LFALARWERDCWRYVSQEIAKLPVRVIGGGSSLKDIMTKRRP
jgi:hypothetical protein